MVQALFTIECRSIFIIPCARPSILFIEFPHSSGSKSSAAHFGLSEEWFNTHSIRMSGPTIARAADLSVTNIMRMGRWKSLPAPILYQEQSTALNDHVLSVINDPNLFTSDDILLSRVLASRPGSSKLPTLRQYNKGKR